MSELRLFPLGFPWETSDPFLFCVHHLDRYPKGNANMGPEATLAGRNIGNDFEGKDGWSMYHGQTVPGFPAHPHCGFETVTIVTRGYCDHSDSLGAAARFGEGDAQWITTGSGLQHSEMFPLLKRDKENTLELFQIWLNLPRKSKFTDPHFSMYWKEQIPIWESNGVSVVLIAGNLNGVQSLAPPPNSWAAEAENDVHIGLINMSANSQFTLPKAHSGSLRRLYLFDGDQVKIGNKLLPSSSGAAISEDAVTLQSGSGAARLLWLQGKPIQEPVARYGPFVMNESEEIQKAIDQFRLTQFGGWPWRHQDPVHESDSGRFAVFPDGRKITPGN